MTITYSGGYLYYSLHNKQQLATHIPAVANIGYVRLSGGPNGHDALSGTGCCIMGVCVAAITGCDSRYHRHCVVCTPCAPCADNMASEIVIRASDVKERKKPLPPPA